MLQSRTLTSPLLRTALRPQNVRLPVTARPASIRAQIAAMSSISDVITSDHREIQKAYDEIVNSTDVDHQTRYGNQFTWELARHSVAEELIVYPAFEKYLGHEGKTMADKDREEHHKVKEFLKKFQNMSPQDSDYVPQLKSLMTVLQEHIAEEEKDDLPALEKALSHGENQGVSEKLATNFGRTKAFVPSRSHPSAGENPPFETVMGLLTAPIDHIADIFRKFPEGKVSPNPSKE